MRWKAADSLRTDPFRPGTKVIHRNQAIGTGYLVGGKYPCQMEGCRGSQLATRWPDGTITYPCTREMVYTIEEREGEWRML